MTEQRVSDEQLVALLVYMNGPGCEVGEAEHSLALDLRDCREMLASSQIALRQAVEDRTTLRAALAALKAERDGLAATMTKAADALNGHAQKHYDEAMGEFQHEWMAGAFWAHDLLRACAALAASGAKESGENDAASGESTGSGAIASHESPSQGDMAPAKESGPAQAATPDSITLTREALRALVERAVRYPYDPKRVAARVLAEWDKP